MDLPGQQFFPWAGPGKADAAPEADAARLLTEGLPDKATVTTSEAAKLMHCCRRTVENWVADGTLLAVYANRDDEAKRKHARILVRAARPYDSERSKFLTLAELRIRRSNVGGN
jgi:hypothetical protein